MRISDWSSDVCSSDLRLMNPTTGVLEERLAALEGGAAALAVASGHAAQVIVFHTLMEPGCNIVAANKLYGGSINQLGQSFRKMGWESRFVDADDPAAFAAAIDENTPTKQNGRTT